MRRKADRRRRGIAVTVVSLLVEAAVLWNRTGRPAGNVVVRCRSGHLFTTIWIPGVSVKALRLGPWRIQRCPVGRHWSLVWPAKASQLSARELRRAREQRDIRLP